MLYNKKCWILCLLPTLQSPPKKKIDPPYHCAPKWHFWFFYLNYTKPSRLDYNWPVESIFQGFQILGLRFQGQKNSELQEGYSYNLVLWWENVMCVWENTQWRVVLSSYLLEKEAAKLLSLASTKLLFFANICPHIITKRRNVSLAPD